MIWLGADATDYAVHCEACEDDRADPSSLATPVGLPHPGSRHGTTQQGQERGLELQLPIEQDADLVMFIYRDEYYEGEESDQQGLAEVQLAKHRNGPTDLVKLSFLRRFAKFADLAPS